MPDGPAARWESGPGNCSKQAKAEGFEMPVARLLRIRRPGAAPAGTKIGVRDDDHSCRGERHLSAIQSWPGGRHSGSGELTPNSLQRGRQHRGWTSRS
jgi:hypothetical protein